MLINKYLSYICKRKNSRKNRFAVLYVDMSKLQKQVTVPVPLSEEHKHMEGDDQTSIMATKFVDEILESAINVISTKINQLQTITTEGESCLFAKKSDMGIFFFLILVFLRIMISLFI